MVTSIPVITSSTTSPRVHLISSDHPWKWLGAGWNDMWRAPAVSISYGLLFTMMGYMLVYMFQARFHVALALTSGFLLAGPLLAVGLYDVSRRFEAGEPVSLGHALFAWRLNPLPIFLFGLFIGLLMVVWVRLAMILFVVIAANSHLQLDSAATQIFFSGSGLIFLVIFTLVGALIAAVVFTVSVVSIPMLLDHKTDLITAILTSIVAVRANPIPMLFWALLIVIFTGIGLLTFYLGLAIALPLIGHASWHAYRDLVDNSETEQNPL